MAGAVKEVATRDKVTEAAAQMAEVMQAEAAVIVAGRSTRARTEGAVMQAATWAVTRAATRDLVKGVTRVAISEAAAVAALTAMVAVSRVARVAAVMAARAVGT